MSAGCPKRASYTWKSILHGRDLLKEGGWWRIGNGKQIKVWEQNWIPRDSLKRPLVHKPEKEVEKVAELLLPSGGGWNTHKLNETLFETDVTDILKIPVGRSGTENYLAWNYT